MALCGISDGLIGFQPFQFLALFPLAQDVIADYTRSAVDLLA